MDKKDALFELGNKIRSCRISKGITQTDLAHSIGKDQPSINRLELSGVNPSYLYLLEVCEGLGVSLAELLQEY